MYLIFILCVIRELCVHNLVLFLSNPAGWDGLETLTSMCVADAMAPGPADLGLEVVDGPIAAGPAIAVAPGVAPALPTAPVVAGEPAAAPPPLGELPSSFCVGTLHVAQF